MYGKEGSRTPIPHLDKVMLDQLSYFPGVVFALLLLRIREGEGVHLLSAVRCALLNKLVTGEKRETPEQALQLPRLHGPQRHCIQVH